MSDTERKRDLRKELEAHLESPLPLLLRLKNVVFGKTIPDYYTQFSFFLSLIVWIIFTSWSILGSIAIRSRFWMETEKGIDVSALVSTRGEALGFTPESFIGRLETFYALAIVFWIIVFIGIVLLWRKMTWFPYFIFGGAALYLLAMWFILGFSYWYNDTTFFDKLCYILFVGHTAVYFYFFRREMNGEVGNFFGVDDNE